MAYGCFTDKSERPDERRAGEVVRSSRSLWDELLAGVRAHTRAAPAWRFYGRNYGWALAFKKGGRALAAAFPDEDGFTVLVVLAAAQADTAAADASLSPAIRGHVAGLPRFREGCWVFVRVASRDQLRDALTLVEIRAAGAAKEQA